MSKKTRAQLLAELAELKRVKAEKLAQLAEAKARHAEEKRLLRETEAELIELSLKHPGIVIDISDEGNDGADGGAN